MRSRAAASVLASAGFQDVASLAGGIKAWQGLTAAGPPEAGMSFFTLASDAEDQIALAWVLEEGSRKFYAALAEIQNASGPSGIFSSLVNAEEQHKSSLEMLYREMIGKNTGSAFPRDLPIAREAEGRMEGNVNVSEALSWASGKEASELLELSMALEADSYDLYIKMGRTVPGEKAQKVFARLVAEEKEHLKRMADLLDKTLLEKA